MSGAENAKAGEEELNGNPNQEQIYEDLVRAERAACRFSHFAADG